LAAQVQTREATAARPCRALATTPPRLASWHTHGSSTHWTSSIWVCACRGRVRPVRAR